MVEVISLLIIFCYLFCTTSKVICGTCMAFSTPFRNFIVSGILFGVSGIFGCPEFLGVRNFLGARDFWVSGVFEVPGCVCVCSWC